MQRDRFCQNGRSSCEHCLASELSPYDEMHELLSSSRFIFKTNNYLTHFGLHRLSTSSSAHIEGRGPSSAVVLHISMG